MQLRSIRRLAILAGMAVVASLASGTSARADVMLTLTDDGSGASITINNDTGVYTYSHGAAGPTTGTFLLDGQSFSYSSAGGAFTVAASNISFTSDGSFGTSAFGQFNANISINANLPGGATAKVFDTNIATKNVGPKSADLIASVTVDGFTSPGSVGTLLSVTNALAASNLDSGNATFVSAVNGQSTPTATLSSTEFAGGTFGKKTVATATETSNPFTITNTLTANNLGVGDNANLTGTTTAVATPEPATIAMALAALPLLGLGAWTRRRRAQA